MITNPKVFECTFETKEGTQTGHMIAKDEGSAARGLILTAKQELTSIHVDIKEVDMSERTFLGIIIKEKENRDANLRLREMEENS